MSDCDTCAGSGRIRKTDIIRAKTVEERCPICRGTGQKDAVSPDGIYVQPDPGVLHYFYKLLGGHKVCVIQTIIEQVQPPKGIIQKIEPYYVVSILNMNTRNKDRGKGYASEVIDTIKKWNRNSVKFIITSWDSSADESRKLLMKLGFERNNAILIWRKDGKKHTDATGAAESRGDSPDSKADEAGVRPELVDNPQGAGGTPETGSPGVAQPGESAG